MFDLEDLGRNRLKVDFAWLNIYNRKILETTPMADLIPIARNLILEKLGESVRNLPPELNVLESEYIEKAITYAFPRVRTIKDILDESLMFFWCIPRNLDGVVSFYELNEARGIVDSLSDLLESQEIFEERDLGKTLKSFCVVRNLKFSNFMHFVRFILSGVTVGPPVGEMLELLGKTLVLKRLELLKKCI